MPATLIDQLLLRGVGPKDPVLPGSDLSYRLSSPSASPYPPGPSHWPGLLNNIVSQSAYETSLQAWVPVLFSIVYYIIAHGANHVTKHGTPQAKDLTKSTRAPGLAAALRWLVVGHNAFLALYSGWTFYHVVPVVFRFFLVGARAAGLDGVKLALCSMPINTVTLAPYAWLFYISKYYEVVDSIILVLKGKKVSNLQSYHHAGALLAMWIAYRYQSQAVWVFVAFNSGVHTAMYSYYFCSSMKLPFPRTLKRNLTTLQIAQITSGVVLTNLYWITTLNPTRVAKGLVSLGFREYSSSTSTSSATWTAGSELLGLATKRAAGVRNTDQCLESSGASLALHFNTAYLVPLVVLFARFFVRSYLRQQSQQHTSKGKGKAAESAAKVAADRSMASGDGAASTAVERNGHSTINGNGSERRAAAAANGNGNGKRKA